WPPPVLVIMSKKLCFISRHVHVGRTLRLACFTGEAQIKRSLDLLILPATADDLALKHFKQHVRAAARAVFFLQRGHIAWTHGARVFFTARSQADTAQGKSLGKRTTVLGIFGKGWWLQRLVISGQTQVLGWRIRIDDLTWVHLVVGIPNLLEFTKRVYQLRAKHFWQ